MDGPTVEPLATSQGPRSKELPCGQRTPWFAIILLLITLVCMGASAAIIIVSDKQAVASWMVQPAVLLAVLSSVLNFALAAAFSISVTITWWRSAEHGAPSAHLHYIWNRGAGLSFISAITAGVDARKVALAAALVATVKFVNNPLLQRATHIRTQDMVTNDTMMLDMTQRIPDGWMATIGNGSSISVVGSRNGLSTVQAWWWNNTITSRNIPSYYCDGTCEGKVQGAGISYICSSTTEALDLSTSKNDGSVVFAINSTMSQNSTGAPFLLLTTLYSSAVNDSCIATLSVDTCSIEAGVVEYPVTIQNSTITLNYDELQNMTVVSTYTSAGDLPTAPESAGAGPLIGLNNFYGYYLYANVTEVFDVVLNKSTYSGPSMIADLFFMPQSQSYDNHTFATCGLRWNSPTEYVLNSMHDFMFRAALSASNGTVVQTFTAQRTIPALFFHSDCRYLAAALAITLPALLVVFFLLWGWWELGRHVTLSPLETAQVFVSMMRNIGRNSTVEEIMQGIGEMAVKYNDEVIVNGERGIAQQAAEQGYDDKV